MNKRNKIIYWIATIWLALGMTSTAIVQLVKMKEEVQKTSLDLGYPVYFLTIIGIWKLLGVVVILLPKFLLLKEWAYAGFFFLMSGAIISHLCVEDSMADLFGPSLLLILTILSWYFRPANRKLVGSNYKTVRANRS
ncbi:DoxX family protein [Sphingobacterium chuzhouense]|uniref:DoxX family protein n=1 Tax=Sphingobacterium chuzhouense TaxID=1742264 RepID=A0ABR7XV66_9SPHI|nr:DoxX family protein [Sphingobacterium chuzhouense]MBD1422923.1 DoxX family protein [Sphingobacterium chuzhouense]